MWSLERIRFLLTCPNRRNEGLWSLEGISFLLRCLKVRNEGLWSLEGICFLFRCLEVMNDQPAGLTNIEGSGWIGLTKAFAS